MTVTSRWTGPAPAALLPAFTRLQADVEASIMARLKRGAEAAYAGTRFARTFVVRETTLFSTDPIFQYVEEKTGRHEIHAKNGPYLWFKGGKGWARVAMVNHPGTKGKYFIQTLLDAFGGDIEAQLGRGWESLHVQ